MIRLWRSRATRLSFLFLALLTVPMVFILSAGTTQAGADTGWVSNVVVQVGPEATGYKQSTYTITFVATDGLGASGPRSRFKVRQEPTLTT